jgi:O-methyltransferase involved in polyketide biosynthesis
VAPERTEPTLSGPPMSALGVAVIRARESSRPDHLYDDPYARFFVEAARREFLEAGAAARWEQI